MRKFIDLNFNWKFTESFTEEMTKPSFDDSSFEKVDIPHTVKELPYNYFDEKSYQKSPRAYSSYYIVILSPTKPT